MGRKPKPTQQRVLAGNPGRRPLNLAEPQLPEPVADTFDVPPIELQTDLLAANEWTRLAPMLRAARQVTVAERGVLIALCLAWSQFLQAHEKIAIAGMVVASPERLSDDESLYLHREQGAGALHEALGRTGTDPHARVPASWRRAASRLIDEFSEFDMPFPIGTPESSARTGRTSDEGDDRAAECPPAVASSKPSSSSASRTRSSSTWPSGASWQRCNRRTSGASIVVRADLERKLEAWRVT